jgi:hypothetical protein
MSNKEFLSRAEIFALIILFILPSAHLFSQTNDSALNAQLKKIMATIPEYHEPVDSATAATIRNKVENLPEYQQVLNLHTWGVHIYIRRVTGNIVEAEILTFEENADPSILRYYIKYNKNLKKIVAVKKAENP